MSAQRTAADLSSIYNSARQLMQAGQYTESERIVRGALLASRPYPGGAVTVEQLPVQRMNALLLALEGDLIASGQSASSRDLLDAEAYLASAIYTWRCDPDFWRKYVDIRLRREGIDVFTAELKSVRGPTYAFPGTSMPIPVPGPPRLLEALMYRTQGEEGRARALLTYEREHSGACPVPQLLGVARTRIASHSSSSVVDSGPATQMPPLISAACSYIDQGSYKSARAVMLDAPAASRTRAGAFALFVISLLMTDAAGTERWFSEWKRLDAGDASRCRNLNIPGVIASLHTGVSKQRKREVGQLLDGLAMEFFDDRLASSAAISFDAKVLKSDPTTLAALLEQTRQAKHQQQFTDSRIGRVERELVLHHTQLAVLNNDARLLLFRIGAAEERVSDMNSSLRIQAAQFDALEAKVDEIHTDLTRAEGKLRRLLEEGDPRVLALVDSLRSEVRRANDAATQQRMQPPYPIRYVAAIDRGQSPAQIETGIVGVSEANRTHRISSMLGELSNVVSVSIPVGIFQINVVGLLAKLFELAQL